MSDSRAAPKNSLETLNRLRELREATQRVCDMPPPASPQMETANQKVALDALDLHAANLKFLRYCRVDYGDNRDTDPVFGAIEQWARLAPAEKANHWTYYASYLEEHGSTGFYGFLSWGVQLDDWIGQCAGEKADPAAAIAKTRARAPRAGKERGLVFICYCHKDKKWLDEMRIMLAPVIRRNVLRVWDDRKIKPGKKWRREIAKALRKTKVGVLLVTKNFLESKFINEVELKYLLENAQTNHIKLLPVYVGHCMWEKSPLGELQFANGTATPLAKYRGANHDMHLKEVCEKIQAAYNERPHPNG
ncbi:MAG: toll/interleukin-1 receptor domain-containing protein [Planctomycetota bacterium]|nr:toll/interleukin-1 receptor domain-containing protein [Planctomycetota bacterium]